MNKKRAGVVSLILVSLLSIGATNKGPEINKRMSEFRNDARTLFPLLFDNEKLTANEATFRTSALALRKHAETLDHRDLFKNNVAAKTNFKVLVDALKDVEQSVKRKNYSYAAFLTRASLQMCISCHTSGANRAGYIFEDDAPYLQSLPNVTSKVEYLFMTRQFEIAKKEIEGYFEKTQGFDAVDAEFLAYRLALYYAQVHPQPKEATKVFADLAKKPNVKGSLKESLGVWSTSFAKWQPGTAPRRLPITNLKDIKTLVAKPKEQALLPFEENRVIDRMHALAGANSLLSTGNLKTKAQQAEAIYNIGLAYNALNRDVLLGLDDAYFRACIEHAPATAIAKNCFRSLKDNTIEKSTGTSGTHLDEEEKHMLDKYKDYADGVD